MATIWAVPHSKLEEGLLSLFLFELLFCVSCAQILNLLPFLTLVKCWLHFCNFFNLLEPLLFVVKLQVSIGPVVVRQRHLSIQVELIRLNQQCRALLHLLVFLGIFDNLWFKRGLDVIFLCKMFGSFALLFLKDLHLQLFVDVLSLTEIHSPKLILKIFLTSLLFEHLLLLKGLLKISAFCLFNINVESNLS